MNDGFQRTLDHIRAIAESEAHKGRLFERLMKTYFTKDPIYRERFSAVWLWSEWASAASAREPFTARIVVDTGDEWGTTASKAIEHLKAQCFVHRFGDLASRPFDWPDLRPDEPENLSYQHEPFSLRPHQQAAFDDVIEGFQANDRGKLIMASGTGKTFVALRIAEAVADVGGRTLYLVPSIALFAQAMREWATQQAVPHRYIGICSDTTAGRKDEDASLHELEIPVTTDATAVSMALRMARPEAMTVVFCTCQSLGIIEQAQREGAPALDLVLCDEAHRTTGIEQAETKTSPFVLVHDSGRIRAEKRLYMTATPRLYTEGAKTKAARHDVEVFSMDDPETYGPEFHRLAFSQAVQQDLLTDYRVVVLSLSEQVAEAPLQAHLTSDESEINISDATKIIGCWRALQNPERKTPKDGPIHPLARAIAFTNTIKASKRLDVHRGALISQATEQLPVDEQADALRCETRHVDGQHNALDRKARIEWLKGDPDGACRILSNARCLTEGIDVPALDAVLFMSPRNSHIEIVQAVGRVMRKAEGKEYGYIVLPIAVPPGADPADVLDDTDRFSVVWSVLRALRSHDDRLDAEINQIDLNKELPARIIIDDNGGDVPLELPFPPMDMPPGAIFAKIVERCGDRKYWETWAKDVAAIFASLVSRIENLLDNRWERLQVFAGGDEHHYGTRAPDRPMIVKDLLTHTSGLTYGFMHSHPVDALYRACVGTNDSLEAVVATLRELPLQFSPGTRWQYGMSTDVVGYLVQVLSGQPLDDYIAEYVTGPLGMADSGFTVPAEKADRFAACYECGSGEPGTPAYRLTDDPATSRYLGPPAMLSGGGGMVATIDDYRRFADMLLGKGELDGVRLLGRKTVEYMTCNHLPGHGDLAAMGMPVFSETPFVGFGLGFSVALDPAAANVIDSPGQFAWGGLAGTYFWVDPVEELSVIFFAQLVHSDAIPASPPRLLRRRLKPLIYQALID